MKVLPQIPGRGQRVMDVVFRIALLLLMAGVAFHAVVGEAGVEGGRSAALSQHVGVP